MLGFLKELGPRDLVICLISGGGSALLPAPAPGLTLSDKQKVTELLHAAGATINEMNAVRKHLSGVKGGQLARSTRARVVSLVVSDVVGDPIDVIASGPTAVDPTSYHDALEVLKSYRLLDLAPSRVVKHLREGKKGNRPETLKRESNRISNHVIGNNRVALEASARHARSLGYRVVNLSSFLEGDSRELGVFLAGTARGIRDQLQPGASPVCVLSGGETTVNLGPRPGKGGRNQELVLGALVHLASSGVDRITLLSGGTDGEDGPTDAAGAVADVAVLRRSARLGLDPGNYLAGHDAYSFFDRTGGLIRTGPTHTNVMDSRVILVQPPPR
jgi:glycerate 2-kinase